MHQVWFFVILHVYSYLGFLVFCAAVAIMDTAVRNATTSALSTCVWARARVGSAASWDMCTYPRSVDRWVSGAVQKTGCWIECADVEWMLSILGRSKDAELLDIGGNIGFYTGAAAAAGHAVTVFEPSPDNAMHLLATVRHNSWRHVRLFSLCVSDATSPCVLSGHRDNQGSLQHEIGGGGVAASLPGTPTAVTKGAGRPKHPTGWRKGMVTTMAVSLDEVLPPRLRPTFLKIDVEGSECAAFRGMTRLLNASTRIVGALVEFDKSHQCCHALTRPPGSMTPAGALEQPPGAFWMLRHRHGLCAYQAPIDKPAQLTPTPLSGLCALRGSSKQLNLRWQPCPYSA
jgi:FkbM family methyltransferase